MELTHEKIERRVINFGRAVQFWATPRRLAVVACLILVCWLMRYGWRDGLRQLRENRVSDDGITFDASDLPEASEEARPILTHIHFVPRGIAVTATIYDNVAGRALTERLLVGPITLELENYNDLERVGWLDQELPQENETLHVQAGDIALFAGNQLGVYYDENSWSMTPLGKIDNVAPSVVGLMFSRDSDEPIELVMSLMTQEELDNLVVAKI